MSDQALATTKPTEIRISPKVRAAIEAMVWDGLPRDKAAEAAGISEHGLYKAFRKPPVKAAYLAELEVLRTSERARNIHRLREIRDAANNMPAVQAIDRLERGYESESGASRSGASLPGVVIVIGSGPVPTQQPRVVDGTLAPQDEKP